MLKLYWRYTDVFLGELSSEDQITLRKNFEASPDNLDGEYVAYIIDHRTLKGSKIELELAEILSMALKAQEIYEGKTKEDETPTKAVVYIEDDFDDLSNFYLRLPDQFKEEISKEDFVFLIEKMETADGFSFELDKAALNYLNTSGINAHLKTVLTEVLGEQERVFISVEDTEDTKD